MTFYSGLDFFFVLLIGCIPAVILGLKEKSSEKYLLFFSLLMVLLIYTENIWNLLYLGAFLCLEWFVIRGFQHFRRTHGQNVAVFRCAILLALLPLIIAKCSGLIGQHWFSFIGISYITFKVVQVVIETHDGIIEHSDFCRTMNFLLFFPTLSSGPIDRSRRFENDLVEIRPKAEYIDMMQLGLRKIFLGALYKFVLSGTAFAQLDMVIEHYYPQHMILYAYIYAYVYGIYMFFDFAGYSLMAVGTGYLFGIKVPDNFNKPFISVDIKEFWDRWHISLSHWFRDFVFSRFMMDSIRKKRFKNRMNAASAGYIVNMLVMGIWHGISIDYLLYGLYHGILLALMERWQKKKWYKQNRNKRWYKLISWFVTLNLVMFGFLIFSGQFLQNVSTVLYRLFG